MPSSPPLRWSDLVGARVGVWGLGVEGRANVGKLVSLGIAPLLVDDRPPEDSGGPEILVTSSGGLEALARCEVVVKTPGISRYRTEVTELEARGIAVVGGLGLWLEEADRERVLLVTGTKGKSTTASIAGHLLAGLGERVRIGGNLGAPPYGPSLAYGPGLDDAGAGDPAAVVQSSDWWVVEVSSYQATDLWSATPVVAVTSLSPDHLDWHGTSERYYADKLAICGLPGARTTVANGADGLLRQRLGPDRPAVCWVEPEEGEQPWTGRLGLAGRHNRINAALARRALLAAGVSRAGDDEALAAAAEGFRPLPSRLELVASCDGVDFVDDGLATNVLPTIAALEAFADRPVALVAGGFDRGIDYGPLAAALWAREAPTRLLAIPDSGRRILEAVEEVGARTSASASASARAGTRQAKRRRARDQLPEIAWKRPETVACSSLEEAVELGFSWARPDGIVLLSPAAPSFGRFADYRERSEAFLVAARASCGGDARAASKATRWMR